MTASSDGSVVEPNALGRALGLLGDEWTLLIVKAALEGVRRYGDWKDTLVISDAVLTARLRTLVGADVLERRQYQDAPARFEYRLTASGLGLWRLLLAVWDWERRYAVGQADSLPVMVHADCDAAFHPVLTCGRCNDGVRAVDVDATFGPSGGYDRSAPVGSNRRRTSRSDAGGPGLFPETMAIIGSRWSSAVIGAAFLGASRFRDFERALGAPPTVLAERLRTFVDLGVLATDHDAPDYRLTTKGQGLFGVVVALLAWAERWLPSADGPAVVATHRPCGATLVPVWRCSACAGELAPTAVRALTPTPA